jgi:DNA polymerase I
MNFSKALVVDIETDGLNPTVVHCVCANGDMFYDANTFNSFLSANHNKYDMVVGHNIIGFDCPALTRLWKVDFSNFSILDSLVLSRLANPSRDGGHSLRSWGERLNFPKGDYSDWSTLTPEMVEYCKQDVAVTRGMLKALEKELEGFSDESIQLEHEVQSIVVRQIKNGWKLDQPKARDLLALLKERQYDLESEVQRTFKPLPTFIKEIVPKVKKDGTYSDVGLKFLGGRDSINNVSGAFSRVDYPAFNLGSRQQIARHLQYYGWKPTQLTEYGTKRLDLIGKSLKTRDTALRAFELDKKLGKYVKVDETLLESVKGIPQAALIAEYLMLQKRIGLVSSWIDAVDDTTGRVHGYVNSIGAVTGRMTHSSPNMAQVPSNGSPYGVESRGCWVAAEGYSLVGCDASGLELRMLAHYMDDKDYTSEVLDGDIHTANMLAAGLTERPQAKTFIYAFLYGAGDAKIGSIVGGGAKEGKRLKDQFLANTPALAKLKDRVAAKAKAGYLNGLDGRKVYVRSEHAALNTLLQSAGAIIMKKALTLLSDYAKLWGIEHRFVGNIHDEFQCEVIKGKEDVFGRLAVSCIQAAGLHFKLRCPLDGDYKVGESWANTH